VKILAAPVVPPYPFSRRPKFCQDSYTFGRVNVIYEHNIMSKHLAFFIAIMAVIVSGCASSKVSVVPVAGALTQSVKIIAISPDSGLLAEAVAVELSNRGYTIIDSATTSRTMVRLNLNEIDIARPEGLAKLRDQGIDALLTVRAAGGYDEQPQSATARVSSTHTGRVVAGIIWQNGWGGQAGSIADRTMRKGLAQAAKEIADALAKNLRTEN
jgi:hypothetical protein